MLFTSLIAPTPAVPFIDGTARQDLGSRSRDCLAIAIGSLMVLCVSGYQFGRGNHTVYLLDALRYNDPTLFAKDWFVTGTLQYHAAFTRVTAAMIRAGILRPAFLVGYLTLIVLWQRAWLGIARALGASRTAYLFSVVLYLISGAGIALGVYQFLQDGCLLPSNVSNVAMLAAFYCWIIGRRTASGTWFGIAGLFHLNYAVIAVGAWTALSAWTIYDRRHLRARDALGRAWWFGSLLALAPSLFNVWIALQVKLHESSDALSMQQFVAVYVRFRHPHHFDPLHYPLALWIAFLWPLPIAVIAWRKRLADAEAIGRKRLHEAAKIFALMLALQVLAFLFAGVWFINETLVQLMLWRFSIYVKLLSCLAVAWLVCDAKFLRAKAQRTIFAVPSIAIIAALIGTLALSSVASAATNESLSVVFNAIKLHWKAILLFAFISATPLVALQFRDRLRQLPSSAPIGGCVLVIAIVVLGWNRCFGWGMTPELVDDAYLRVCEWARLNTPRDAVFIVPPAETAFRLEANRAVVVNYKHVPQLGAELVEWLKRLEDVLGVNDVTHFPHNYIQTMRDLNATYEARSPVDLINVARRWNASYIVVDHEWPSSFNFARVYSEPTGRYFIYDVDATRLDLPMPSTISAADRSSTTLPVETAR